MITTSLPDTASYGRVSTDKQDTITQEHQIDQYVSLRALRHLPEFHITDPDTSGTIPFAERAGGRRLLQLFHSYPAIRNLVVAKLDRLGRNTIDVLTTLNLFKERGITVHIINLGGESINTSSPLGKVFITVVAACAELEVETLRERVQDKMKSLRGQGLRTGTEPYGWRHVWTGAYHPTKKDRFDQPIKQYRLEPIPEELAWVAHMARRREQGWSYKRIATELNTLGVPTKIPAGTLLTLRKERTVEGVLHPAVTKLHSGRWQQGSVLNVLTCSYVKAWLAGPMTEVSHLPLAA